MVSYDSRILIVGAGVFGLTTALHLAKRKYTNIHLFDSVPYDANGYKCSEGCTAASADENKVIRASYGGSKLYQDLAFAAIPEWRAWNQMLSQSKGDELEEKGWDGKLFDQCGLLRLSENGLERAEVKTQANSPEELRGTQFRVSDAQSRRDAEREGVTASKMDALARLEKGLPTDGYLDLTAGYVLARRACAFALRLCQEAGVQTYLGPGCGMKELVREGESVKGIVTQDGGTHHADLSLWHAAAGRPVSCPRSNNWSTTAGSVFSFRLPPERTDLWAESAPENFPVWCWNMTTYDHDINPLGGILGFPRTPEGGEANNGREESLEMRKRVKRCCIEAG